MSVRVAVIGYGMGRYHCSDISKTPGLQLYAVCDIDPERRRSAQDEWKVKTYASYEQVLADEKVDMWSWRLLTIPTPRWLFLQWRRASMWSPKR